MPNESEAKVKWFDGEELLNGFEANGGWVDRQLFELVSFQGMGYGARALCPIKVRLSVQVQAPAEDDTGTYATLPHTHSSCSVRRDVSPAIAALRSGMGLIIRLAAVDAGHDVRASKG